MPRRAQGALVALAAACVTAVAVVVVVRDPTAGSGRSSTQRSAARAEVSPAATATTSANGSATAAGTSQAPAPPPPPVPPPFSSSVEGVSAAQLGASWRQGCPVGPEQLRAVEVSHWGFDGGAHTGRVIVHADQVEHVVAAFGRLYDLRFPVERMVPVDAYGGDDQASMRANNTSAFNCRTVAGTSTWSEHAFGRAIDVNPLVNPYVKGSSIDPPEGAPYADRSRREPGMFHDGGVAVEAFEAQGWHWGGYWSSGKDYQHFSTSGR